MPVVIRPDSRPLHKYLIHLDRPGEIAGHDNTEFRPDIPRTVVIVLALQFVRK